MQGGLFIILPPMVIVECDLPTLPTNGCNASHRVPLHTLHTHRALDGGILNKLALCVCGGGGRWIY